MAFRLSNGVRGFFINFLTVLLAVFVTKNGFISNFKATTVLFVTVIVAYLRRGGLPEFLAYVLLICLTTFSFDVLTPKGTFHRLTIGRSRPGVVTTVKVALDGDVKFVNSELLDVVSLAFIALVPVMGELTYGSRFGFSRP